MSDIAMRAPTVGALTHYGSDLYKEIPLRIGMWNWLRGQSEP